jgi:hypothetical protein
VWLVQPLQRTLEVLRRQGSEWVIAGVFEGNAMVRAEPFDAIELGLGVLWADVELPAGVTAVRARRRAR